VRHKSQTEAGEGLKNTNRERLNDGGKRRGKTEGSSDAEEPNEKNYRLRKRVKNR